MKRYYTNEEYEEVLESYRQEVHRLLDEGDALYDDMHEQKLVVMELRATLNAVRDHVECSAEFGDTVDVDEILRILNGGRA